MFPSLTIEIAREQQKALVERAESFRRTRPVQKVRRGTFPLKYLRLTDGQRADPATANFGPLTWGRVQQ